MKLRMPSGIEMSFQILLTLAFALLVSDYLQAMGSSTCDILRPEDQRDCYPWGGTEGPAANFWYYKAKEIYLKTGIASLGILTAAIVVPFLMPGPWTGFGVALFLSVIGFLRLEWLADLIG